MATYAVGDIQGCLPHLKLLLKQASFKPKKDALWFAGDLVNRGPESLETLRFAKSLGNQAKIVLGNHDLHLLACWSGTRRPTKKDTFSEILSAPDANELMKWLIQQPLIHYDKKLGYAMVHAGIPPQWSLSAALNYAREVETALKSPEAHVFFAKMYGSEPAVWSDDLRGTTRLRVITNYFTRMRFCKKNGELEFNSKGHPDDPPEGFKPWFQYKHHLCRNDRIIFGHWAAMLGNTQSERFIGLDTGCVWGGALTMMRLEDGERFCVECAL